MSLSKPSDNRLASVSKQILSLANKSLAAWASVVVLLILATVSPSAYGVEFARTTHISIPIEGPPAGNLAVVPAPPSANLIAAPAQQAPVASAALMSRMQTKALSSSVQLATVALNSQQIELARTMVGAQSVAKVIMAQQYKWGTSQFGCLKTLWSYESHWNYKAHNHSSGAHGIAQALPANKMDVIATDWRTNPVTQIRWGLRYIDIRYSSPCNALRTFNWQGSY